jgi:hypothetical protein
MKVNLLIFYCFLIGLLLNTIKINADDNPNEISDYYKNLIETGEIIPLSLLEPIDNEKYNLVIGFLPENKKIEDYFYNISIHVRIDEKTQRNFKLESYNLIKELPEYKDLQIEYIEYAIWYYEIFFNKYSRTRGDPTRKCFSIIFNNNYEFISRNYWR